MSLSLTDNRGFDADQLTITLDDADGQLRYCATGRAPDVLIGWKGEPLTEKRALTLLMKSLTKDRRTG